MSKRPWFPLYTADFDRKTKHLSPEAVGCYIRLINFYWDNNGGIELDPAGLCRVMGLDRRRWNQIWGQLNTFFVIESYDDEHTIWLPRLEEELEKTIAISKAKAEAGKKGGQASAKAKHTAKINTHTHTLTDKEKNGAEAPQDEPKEINFWDIADSLKIPRSLVGKMCKTHYDSAVAKALAETAIKKPADPKAFFLGLLKKNPNTGAQPEWQRIPHDDDALWSWAKKHGYGDPGSNETYLQYRNRLKALITQRKDKAA